MPTDFATKRLRVDGVELHTIDEGQGDPVLLLHGFPDSSRLWRHQIPALVAAGYRVLAPDQRGFGDSDKPPAVEQYQIQCLLGDVAGLLDQAGVDRAHVVGHDWGAFIAWGLASFMPARVDRLVALSVSHPATYFGPLEQYERSWYMLLFQFEGVAEQALQRDDWRLLRAWLAGAKDLDVYLEQLARPGALTAGLNWYRANATPAVLFGLGEPTPWPPVYAPTLGVWSSGDAYCGEHGFLGEQPHVAGPYHYERIEDASHWIPLDQPERLNRLLLEFFASGRGSS
jgi:pimeloyl-ACP methyl ester carboxylesterase